jgi:PAS domain S-box-containing protein
MASDAELTRGIANPDRLRVIAEIDKYIENVVSVRNNDKLLGFGTKEGMFGNQLTLLNTIKLKSESISNNVAEQIDEYTQTQFLLRVLSLFLLTGFVVILITLSYRGVLTSIYSLKKYLQELVKGKLPEPLTLHNGDELDNVADLMGEFVKSLRDKVKFAQSLGNEKETHRLNSLSNDDSLANALLDLQISLQKASEEDNKYKIDEKKRAWANEGLAKFSEILRFQTSNIGELSDLIIKNLVKYLNANQGGVFSYVDDIPEDAHLELVSAFAFDRKKYISKRINIGEGLVGTCAQERQTIFMTDIPDGYLSITSGLGESKPRSLLIVPLKTEEDIYGIIEIASFNVLESHELEFVEKLAQSIASTFASLKINVHTAHLLEQSKKQAEEMAQQEEEMRQNLEELQATQEESARKEAEIVSVLGAIHNSSMVMELDMDAKIIEVNTKYCSSIKCFHEDLIGKNLRSICFFDPQTEDYNDFWGELRNGRSVVREEEIHFNNRTFYFTQNYSPIFDQERKPYKILVIASNNTESITLEENVTHLKKKLSIKDQELTGLFNVLDKAIILAELTPDGTIEKANKNYLEITGYLEKEVIGKNARFFLKPEELKQFDLIWSEVEKGKEHKGVVRRTKPTGEEYWLMSAAIPVMDERDQVIKIFFIAQDITEKKLKYQVLEEANKEIERLKALYEGPNNTKE